MPPRGDPGEAYTEALRAAREAGYSIGREQLAAIVRGLEDAARRIEERISDGNALSAERAKGVKAEIQSALQAFGLVHGTAVTFGVKSTAREVVAIHKETVARLLRDHAGLPPERVAELAGALDKVPTRAVAVLGSRRENAATFRTLINRHLEDAAPDLDRLITSGIARGVSSAELAKDVATLLRRGTGSVDTRERYGIPRGRTAGLGSIESDAMRIARTEINNALREANAQSMMEGTIVRAAKWQRSGNHKHLDSCDGLASHDFYGLGAGYYPPERWPLGPHPHCACTQGGPVKYREPSEWNTARPNPPASQLSPADAEAPAHFTDAERREYRRQLERATGIDRRRELDRLAATPPEPAATARKPRAPRKSPEERAAEATAKAERKAAAERRRRMAKDIRDAERAMKDIEREEKRAAKEAAGLRRLEEKAARQAAREAAKAAKSRRGPVPAGKWKELDPRLPPGAPAVEAAIQRPTSGHRTQIRALAQTLGVSEAEVVARLQKKAEELVGGAEMYMRAPSQVMDKIIASGGLLNQHRTNSSRGMLDPAYRQRMEEFAFGFDRKPGGKTRAELEEHPIYGFLGNDPGSTIASGYGDVTFKLKKHVRKRTTWTGDDSLSLADAEVMPGRTRRGGRERQVGDILEEYIQWVPSPVESPSYLSLYVGTATSPTTARPGAWGGNDRGALAMTKADDANQGGAAYLEIQVHGGPVTLADDVDEIMFKTAPTATQRRKLEAMGIKVTVYNWTEGRYE